MESSCSVILSNRLTVLLNCISRRINKILLLASANGKSLAKLNQVDMKYFDFETCSQPKLYGNMIWENMICFGNLEGGKGTCQGDSGGPLVCCGRDAKHWTLYGLVSWAKGGCAAPNRPTVFTNIAHYTDWIGSKIDESH